MADSSEAIIGPSPDGGGIYNPQAGFLNAEARRTLDTPTYSAAAPSFIQIPKDTVIKRMQFKLIASFSVAYAAGSPVLSEFGAFAGICTNVEVNINGNRIIKSISPALARLSNILSGFGGMPRRAYSTSAAAATVTRADREWMAGTVAYPATTEFFLINECFSYYMENPWLYGGARAMSELDVRDVASATVRFNWANATNLQRTGVGATVTYGSQSFTVQTQIIENRARPRPKAGDVLYDYVETSAAQTYTAQARAQKLNLQTGNYLVGVGILCRNGGTNAPPAENLLKNVSLKVNNSTSIQGPVDHADLQDDNVSRFGVVDWLGFAELNSTIASVAGAHPLKGYAHMNLVRNGDWNTAINTSRAAGVDSVNLEFDTPATSGTDAGSYTTNPLEVTAHQHEMRPFVYTR